MTTMYEAASANFKEVKKALTQLERSINQSVRYKDMGAVKALTPVQMLLVSIKAEARIIKIAHMPQGLTQQERDQVLGQEKALDRWLQLIDHAFRRHYRVSRRQALEDRLGHDTLAKRATLHSLIENELKLVISLGTSSRMGNGCCHSMLASQPSNHRFLHR